MRKKILWMLAGLALLAGVAWLAMDRKEPADTRYTGAYRFDDGTLMVIGPRDTTDLRFKMMNGDTGALWPTDKNGNFEGGEGLGRARASYESRAISARRRGPGHWPHLAANRRCQITRR